MLAARLVSDTKRVIVENQNDDPRAIETGAVRRGELVQPPPRAARPDGDDPAAAGAGPIGQTAPLLAEAGQSVAAQQQQAIQRLAEQIVATMEEPW